MDDDNPQISNLNGSQALSATHDASTATTTATDAPRGFVFCFITLLTTFVTLINVASWPVILRSEERRVGKECRAQWAMCVVKRGKRAQRSYARSGWIVS